MRYRFEVEPGLPRSYTKGGTNSDRSRSDRRRVFNLLYGITEDRGGVYAIRPDGSIKVKPPLPIDMVPEGSVAIMVESFYSSLNPSLIGKFEKLPKFVAGMTVGKTIFRPEDGTEVNGELNLIRDPELPYTYDRHWEFLFRCAVYIGDNLGVGLNDSANEPVRPVSEVNTRACGDVDIMHQIEEALGEA